MFTYEYKGCGTMKLTIFTPTYNRGYILPKLYASLIRQTSRDFVWLIVDDGSIDNTFQLVKSWIKDDKIEIVYYKQKNQGKSIAHNEGVEHTNTELFTCVDSDDYLRNNAVEEILNTWKKNYNKDSIGILAFRGYSDNRALTSIKNNNKRFTTLRNAYKKLGLNGDTMLVYKSNVIKKYKFPKIRGEKFVPEAYLYDLLDQEGSLIILPKVLYVGEYLDDGYTKNMVKLLLDNPNGYLTYLNQRLLINNSLTDKITDTIRYVAFCIAIKKEKIISNSVYPTISLITFPAGYLFYRFRYKEV